jgi:hypothetical protein
MKKILLNCITIFVASFIFWSCKKDEIKVIAQTGKPGTLTASNANPVLNSATATDTVETLTWTATDYGFKAATRYTLQFATAGSNFAGATDVNMGTLTTKKYTVEELNQLALMLGLAPGTAGRMEARVKSEISDSVAAVYSNTVTLNLTPYLVIINYPSLYVPGDYQGWAPATAPKISSKSNNGQYEGYVNFPANSASFQFKLTSDPDWNHTIYGWKDSKTTGDSVLGTLESPGGNLFVPSAGYYRLKANTSALTWEAVKTKWGLIGDAIPGTGWNSDVDMTFDPATQVWTVTLNLNPGPVKFRANDAWDIEYGDNGANLSLEAGGANIAIPSAGNYTITLDLHIPGNYSYKVKKN